MNIFLKKFGTTLISRPNGKESLAGFLPVLKEIQDNEKIIIDCEGVLVLAPSWADEFITPIFEKYKNRVSLKNTDNASVKETLKILEL